MPEPSTTQTQVPSSAGASPESSGSPEGASGGQSSWLDSLPQDARDHISDLRRENARYRSERNQSREEAVSLRQRIDTHDRGRVETMAAERLHDARDFLDRVNLDDLRGEDGQVSQTAVSERIDALIAGRPHLEKQRQRPDWGQGARGTGTSTQASFGEALKNRHRP